MADRSVRQVAVLCQLDGAVKGHPGHDLRMGELPLRPANLPDPVVGLAPYRLEMVKGSQYQIR